MQSEIQLSLYHDGYAWGTDDLNTRIHEEDLHRLEDKIIDVIKTDIRFTKYDSVKVTLLFNMDYIPRWLHQFQSHYFNYSFTFTRQNLN